MIKPYKHNGKTCYLIQLSYTEPNGKRHQPKYRTDQLGNRITSERIAKKLEYEYLQSLEAKIAENYSALSFQQWHEKFLESIKLNFKKSTIAQYDGDLKKWLVPELSNKQLSKIKKADIHNFIFEIVPTKNGTAHTQKRLCKNLKRIFQAALEEGYINRNPACGIKVKTPPPSKLVLNTNEAESLLTEARRVHHPFYHCWAMALFTGMRNGELYALRWSDIDEVSGTITISSSWSNKDGLHSTKSNKNRVFPISQAVKELLIELKGIGPFTEKLKGLNGNSHLVTDLVLPRSTEWQHGEQARITKKFCECIGITPIKFHDLRATFITNLLSQGVALSKVMSIVGHSRTSTTDEYLRLAGVDTKGATDQLGYTLPQIMEANVINFSSR